MHRKQRQPGENTVTRRRQRWGRTARLWTPVIGTVLTTAAAVYQAWHGQPPG